MLEQLECVETKAVTDERPSQATLAEFTRLIYRVANDLADKRNSEAPVAKRERRARAEEK